MERQNWVLKRQTWVLFFFHFCIKIMSEFLNDFIHRTIRRSFYLYFDIILFGNIFRWKISNLRLYNVFRIIFLANTGSPLLKGEHTMSAVDKLISYVSSLSPEQIEKIVNQIPRLTSLLSEQAPPCPPGQFLQNQQVS